VWECAHTNAAVTDWNATAILAEAVSFALTRWAWLAVLLGPAAGCHKSWRADTTTPPITFGASQVTRTSLPAVILLRDRGLPRTLPLTNSAYFFAVSKDRLRFHVTLIHTWEEMSDPARWRVWMEDDRGRVLRPAAFDRRVVKPVTTTYDQVNRANVFVPGPFITFTVYKGDGDYVFYRRDLVRKGMRSLTLVMQRPGYEFRYRWSFVDDDRDPLPEATAQRPLTGRCASVETTCVASPSR
jgi:hypothetical protein